MQGCTILLVLQVLRFVQTIGNGMDESQRKELTPWKRAEEPLHSPFISWNHP